MQVVFLPLSCLVGKSFFGWGNWHKHHYVFGLLLLYQSLSSACVKLHFVLLLHVWNICLGFTFLFFNTALSVMPAMRLSHRASLAGSVAVFSKLYSLCRPRSVFNVADVLLRHVFFCFFFGPRPVVKFDILSDFDNELQWISSSHTSPHSQGDLWSFLP